MIDIKDTSNRIRHSVSISEKAIYKKELMKEEYILLSFSTDQIIPFQKGDYILTEYGRFEIVEPAIPAENPNNGGYEYELRFDSPTAKWKNKILFYTRQGNKEKSWSLTSDIRSFIRVVVTNLRSLGYLPLEKDPEDLFAISGEVENTAKQLSFDSTNIYDALTQIVQVWETEWYVADNKIFIGKCETGQNPVVLDSSVISKMSRNNAAGSNYITRIYPFGSTRNIPAYYGKELVFETTEVICEDNYTLFRDKNKILDNHCFFENKANYDEHLLKSNDIVRYSKDWQCIYPAVPTLPDVYYTVDFSKYKLYAYTEHIDFDSTFSYIIYSNTDEDQLFEETFTVQPGSQGTRIPLKNFKIRYGSNINEFKFTIIVSNQTNLGLTFLKETEGNISIKLDDARYNLNVKFLSGKEAGNVYKCLFNPMGHPGNSPDYNNIMVSGSELNVVKGDLYKLHGLIYDKVPASYFTSDHQEADVVTEGIVEKRLRLPKGMDHIDAWENMRDEDVVEGVVAFEEVYPKRLGTISDVSYTIEKEKDENDKETGKTLYIYTFVDKKLKNFYNTYILDNKLGCKFQTGKLAGLDFALNLVESGDNGTKFQIINNEDYGISLPNELRKPSSESNGQTQPDTYILHGYDTQYVTDGLIPAAEEELCKVATEYLKKNSADSSVYTCTTNPVRCAGYISGNHSIDNEIDFEIGQKVELVNPVYSKTGRISRIYGFEKRLDNKFECTYTIGETASYSRIGAIENKVEQLDGLKGKTPVINISPDYKLTVDGTPIGESLNGAKFSDTINVSNSYPTGGMEGTNIYTLSNAAGVISSEFRKPGLVITFLYQLNASIVLPVSYQFMGTSVTKWTYTGNWSKQPGSVPLEGINSLTKRELCGEYTVISSGLSVASLSVTSDSMAHVINQFIKTNMVPDESGEFYGAHSDSSLNIYIRIYNIAALIPDIGRGKFGKWTRLITELDLLNSSENALKYFGGYLESCLVENSSYTSNISPENVFYTQKAHSGIIFQSLPSFVGKVGDKYYTAFNNLKAYSESGINLDVDKIYIDVNNNVAYVLDPDYIYGVIRIGTGGDISKDEFNTVKNATIKNSASVSQLQSIIASINEDGFNLTDNDGHIFMKCNTYGLDVNLISEHFKSLIKEIDGLGLELGETSSKAYPGDKGLSIQNTQIVFSRRLSGVLNLTAGLLAVCQEGVYFTDENGNIHSQYSLEGYQNVDSKEIEYYPISEIEYEITI